MSVSEKYLKNVRKGHRMKVSSVNLEHYQAAILKAKGLNLSVLLRDFLDQYLEKEFPADFQKAKISENLLSAERPQEMNKTENEDEQ